MSSGRYQVLELQLQDQAMSPTVSDASAGKCTGSCLTVQRTVAMPLTIVLMHTSWVVQMGQLVSAGTRVDCAMDGW